MKAKRKTKRKRNRKTTPNKCKWCQAPSVDTFPCGVDRWMVCIFCFMAVAAFCRKMWRRKIRKSRILLGIDLVRCGFFLMCENLLTFKESL